MYTCETVVLAWLCILNTAGKESTIAGSINDWKRPCHAKESCIRFNVLKATSDICVWYIEQKCIQNEWNHLSLHIEDTREGLKACEERVGLEEDV